MSWDPLSICRWSLRPERSPVRYRGPRTVAESPVMARSQPVLKAAFFVPGVAEAIVADGVVEVRLGRLFDWAQADQAVREALKPFAQ